MNIHRVSVLWYAGTALAVGVLTVAPFLIWSCTVHHGIVQPCWRIPMTAPIVFDLWAYLEFMGSEIADVEYGGLLKWFGSVIRWIGHVLPGASLPEIWLMLRWIFGTWSLWMFAWIAGRITGASVRLSRVWSVLFWTSVFLMLGFRPGAYSWYLPFGLFVLAAGWFVSERLERREWLPAIGWSVTALAASSLYVWFAVVIVLWLSVLWSVSIIQSVRKLWIGLIILASYSALFIVPFVLRTISDDRFRVLWETNIRLGLGFTRLPMFTSMLIAAVLWTACVVWAAWRLREGIWADRLERLSVLWFGILGCWFLSPFTGVYLHTDHFRLITLIAAGLSGLMFWLAFRTYPASIRGRERLFLSGIGAIALLFVVNILFQPYAFNGDQLQTIHLTVWFLLLIAVLVSLRPSVSLNRTFIVAVCIGAGLIGALPYVAAFVRNDAIMKDAHRFQMSIAWIQSQTHSDETICTDPGSADLFAAHTKHRVLVNQQSFFSEETDAALYERLRIIASRYDLDTSGARDAWTNYAMANEGTICQQFEYLDRIPLIRNLPVSVRERLGGCDREKLDRNAALVAAMVPDESISDDAFIQTCPVVVVTRGNRWNLPRSYTEAYADNAVRIFTVAEDARSF